MKKTKAHTRYKTSDGKIVPGVTTICGKVNLGNKNRVLMNWANRLGLQGIDSSKYTDEMADIGTLTHHMIQCHLQKQEPDLSDYSQNQIDKAENSFLSFLEWRKNQELIVCFCEKVLVSEEMKYGGQVDLYCLLNGKKTLVDIKTSKAIYPEAFYKLLVGISRCWKSMALPSRTALF